MPLKTKPLSEDIYVPLKFIAQVLLPAMGTLYVALAGLWGLPSPEAVGGTVLAVDTFLGTLLHLSTQAYNNSDAKYSGEVHVGPENPDGLHDVSLSLPATAKDISDKKELTLKVVKHSQA